ncbi:MAG: hypothetical protein FJX59_13475 [Alphaproteobacteria bacterium]|nr:hypothetical protein [Alphaproteobacteria bacterium]
MPELDFVFDPSKVPDRVRWKQLDRQSLPSPLVYLGQQDIRIARVRGEWISVFCPLHKGGRERKPSMSVNVSDGHFRCHACGQKGRDIIALHRLINPSLGFREAVLDLGGCFHD